MQASLLLPVMLARGLLVPSALGVALFSRHTGAKLETWLSSAYPLTFIGSACVSAAMDMPLRREGETGRVW